MADDIYTIALRIDPTQANQAVRSVSSNVDTIGKGASGLKFPFDSLVAGSSKFATGLSGITAALGPIGAALATCGISMKMFLDGAERADRLTDMSERLGATVEGLQKMEYALTHMGMSTTQADKILEKLAGKFEELKNGEKGVTEAFGRIGISARDINLQDFQGSLDKVRAAMKAVGIETVDANKFLKEILGTRDALRAKDFFNGADGELRNVTVLTAETAAAIKEMKEGWEDMTTSMQNSVLNNAMEQLSRFSLKAKEVARELKELFKDAPAPQGSDDPRRDPTKLNKSNIWGVMEPIYKNEAYVRKDTGKPDENYKPNDPWTKDSIPEDIRKSVVATGGKRPVAHDEMRLQTKDEYINSTEERAYERAKLDSVRAISEAQEAAAIRNRVAQEQSLAIEKKIEEVRLEGMDAGATETEKMQNSLGRILKLQDEITDLQLSVTTGRSAVPERKMSQVYPKMGPEFPDVTLPAIKEIKPIDKNDVSYAQTIVEIQEKRLKLEREINEFHKLDASATREQATLAAKEVTEEEKAQRLLEKRARDSAALIREEQRAHEERNRAMDEYLAQLGINEGLDLKRIRNAEKIAELATKANLKPDQVKELQDKNIANTQDLSKTPVTQLVKLSLDPKSTEEVKQRAKEALDKAFEAGNVGMWDSFKVGATEALAEFSNMSKNMRSIGKQVVQGLNEGFTKFFESIITGSKNGMDSFKQLATSIISQLLAMMTQAMIVKPILEAVMGLATGGASGAAGGGAPAGGGNLTMNIPSGGFSTANIGHTGLVVGGGFMNTYHTGGTPDAIQVLAKRGETIVPQQDQRGRGNRGGGDGIKIINVTQNDFAEQCARNPDAILNAVGQRRKQIKNMLTQT